MARQTPGDVSFHERMEEFAADADVPVDYGVIVSHETKRAIVNHAERLGVDAVLMERRGAELHTAVFGGDVEWIKEHAPCDVIEIEDRGLEHVETVAIVSDRGPFDAVKVVLADALAREAGATVELLFALEPSAAEQRRDTIRAYLEELTERFRAPVAIKLVQHDDRVVGLTEASRDADLLVIGAGKGGLRGAVFGRPADRIVESIEATAVVVYAGASRSSAVRRFLENRVF